MGEGDVLGPVSRRDEEVGSVRRVRESCVWWGVGGGYVVNGGEQCH